MDSDFIAADDRDGLMAPHDREQLQKQLRDTLGGHNPAGAADVALAIRDGITRHMWPHIAQRMLLAEAALWDLASRHKIDAPVLAAVRVWSAGCASVDDCIRTLQNSDDVDERQQATDILIASGRLADLLTAAVDRSTRQHCGRLADTIRPDALRKVATINDRLTSALVEAIRSGQVQVDDAWNITGLGDPGEHAAYLVWELNKWGDTEREIAAKLHTTVEQVQALLVIANRPWPTTGGGQ